MWGSQRPNSGYRGGVPREGNGDISDYNPPIAYRCCSIHSALSLSLSLSLSRSISLTHAHASQCDTSIYDTQLSPSLPPSLTTSLPHNLSPILTLSPLNISGIHTAPRRLSLTCQTFVSVSRPTLGMPPFCVPQPFSAWNAGDVRQYNAREVVHPHERPVGESRDFDARRVADARHLEGRPASEVSHFQVCLNRAFNSALIAP